MGGTITVESRLGRGTTFEFSFTAGAASHIEPVSEDLNSKLFTGLKILVAEDNKVNQMVTKRMLQKMGCIVDMASDGAAALRFLEANDYNIVLMDLSMPEVDGIEATRRIRLMAGARSGTPIVALTASASTEVRSQCLQAGMNDFLSKPMDPLAVRRVLDRWSRRGAVTTAAASGPLVAR
jgi:CheY-like chemotaxis protein